MQLLEFILIGILQGIFEWLPVSSQGISIIVLTNVFNVAAQRALDMSIFLHLGTLLAAFVYFFDDIKELILKTKTRDVFNFKKNIKFDYATSASRFIFISVFLTVLIGVPIYFLIRDSITTIQISTLTIAIGVLLLLTGVMQIKIKQAEKLVPNLKTSNAFFVGLVQAFSAVPGVSRSGITTSTMLFQGFSPSNAFKYSFLISIPTILIAEIGIVAITGFSFSPLILVSVLFAFIFGYLTIGILMNIAKKLDFSYFCFILGIAYILIGLL